MTKLEKNILFHAFNGIFCGCLSLIWGGAVGFMFLISGTANLAYALFLLFRRGIAD